MANEVSFRHAATGETLYFTIRNVSRQMWNTGGTPNFETLTVANWTSYAISLSESPASSYFYVGNFPAVSGNMVVGWYWVEVFKRSGGSAAISDTMLASFWGYWDGTTYRWWADDTTHLNATLLTGRDVGASVLVSVGTGSGQLNVSGGKIPATLSSSDVTGNLPADAKAINSSTTAAARLALMFASAKLITVDDSTFTPTTTAFETDQTTDNIEIYREQVLFGLDGSNTGVTAPVTAYAFANSKVKLTVETLAAAPSNGHRFLMMGRIEQ